MHSSLTIQIPQQYKKYFWDTSQEQFTFDHSPYVIERLLEYGNIDSLQWLRKTFSHDIIINTIKKSRRIGKKTANFFSLYYHIPSEEVLCLQKDYQNRHKKIWRS